MPPGPLPPHSTSFCSAAERLPHFRFGSIFSTFFTALTKRLRIPGSRPSPLIAPRASGDASSTGMSVGSTRGTLPSPSQVGHQPRGLLWLKNFGSGSGIVIPSFGHVRDVESARAVPSARSTTRLPRPSASASSTAFASAAFVAGPGTIRATTSSTSCSFQRAILGVGAVATSLPSTRASACPRLAAASKTSRWNPLRPRTTGAITAIASPRWSSSSRSKIDAGARASRARSHTGQCGMPVLANSRRR